MKEFQELMKRLYYQRDVQRGKDKTLLWLTEEVGELSRAMRKDDEDALGEEMADVIAWVVSLANILDMNIEELLEKKYPGHCRYCGNIPCSCNK